jgi:hypothetical protein
MKYILDANVIIQPYENYYNPRICPNFLSTMKAIGESGQFAISIDIYNEIVKPEKEDELSNWMKDCRFQILHLDNRTSIIKEDIIIKVKLKGDSLDKNKYVIHNRINGLSLPDFNLIALAKQHQLAVVTNEIYQKTVGNKGPKIPNVCEIMKVRCINIYQFLEEQEISFELKATNNN